MCAEAAVAFLASADVAPAPAVAAGSFHCYYIIRGSGGGVVV